MNQGPVHFIGIGGIGMSAIARILLARGETVTGSDMKATPLIEALRRQGAGVTIGHSRENVRGVRAVVVSSAIDRRNPEYAAARQNGTPVLHRGEMLAQLLEGRRGIAICGTHGKTTTTAMTHAVLRAAGVDASLVLGGIDVVLGTNAHDGTSPWFVTEADESDGSFALLEPVIGVVTNIENDHLVSDDDLPQLVNAFAAFLERLPSGGTAIIGTDNEFSATLTSRDRTARTVTFGMKSDAGMRAANVRCDGSHARFDAFARDALLGAVELGVPGEINVQNALAAITVGRELGIAFPAIASALRDFRGVRRRFDVLAACERMTVVDDYAHHPTAVRATIAAARAFQPGPLVVAFQPHRYTRTAYLARDFADALRDADHVYLAPVYAASEPAIPGVSERSIGEPLTAAGNAVSYVRRVEDLEERILDEAPEGAMVLFLGAGNVTDVAARLAARVTRRNGVRA